MNRSACSTAVRPVLLVVALLTSLALLWAAQAQADARPVAPGATARPFVPTRCTLDGDPAVCANVTGINAGSCLRMHSQTNYTSAVISGYCGQNGQRLYLVCWSTGAGDADGNGDTYWFRATNGVRDGYVNDWYLTTGNPTQWKPYVTQHC